MQDNILEIIVRPVSQKKVCQEKGITLEVWWVRHEAMYSLASCKQWQ